MKTRIINIVLLAVVTILIAAGSGICAIIRVSPNGSGGDGSSWQNAKTSLTATLNTAADGDEIWVAAGTYYPGSARTSSFNLKPGVKVYGGFNGTETILTQRNPSTNICILSGDIGTADDTSDNVYHVVVGADNATINGFVITDGNANGTDSNTYGGGIYMPSGTMTIATCSFENNTAIQKGGAIYFGVGKSIVNNCDFIKNKAIGEDSWGGGAIYMDQYSKAEVSNSTFDQNIADRTHYQSPSHGGAICISYNTSNKIKDCIFTKNSAEYGGAINNNGAPTIDNCTFDGNWSFESNNGNFGGRGGAVYNFGTGCNPVISNCDFTSNSCTDFGAGISNDSDSTPTITNCNFTSNTACYGGGINNWSSSPTIKNCKFTSNSAGLTGGGMGVFHCTSGLVSDCIFDGNSSSDNGGEGGGIGFFGGTFFNIEKCVIANNSAGYGGGIEIRISSPTITNCLIFNNESNSLAEYSNTHGGGIYILAASPTIKNCTIYGNSSTEGAGIFTGTMEDVTYPSDVKLINSIIWGNSDSGKATSQILNTYNTKSLENSYTKLAIDSSCIQGGLAGIVSTNGATLENKGGNISSNPVFKNAANIIGADNTWATYDDGLRLAASSQCINTGTSISAPGDDIMGTLRPIGASVDMGAYEGDSSAPYIKITSPTNESTFRTNLTSINLAGKTYSTDSIVSITYTVTGATTASGTIAAATDWALNGLALNKGINNITFTATDINDKSGTDKIQITILVPSVIYVKATATGANNGSSWTNAYTNLTDAIDAADENDQIWVAKGTYKPTSDADRTKTFALKNDVSLYGGFAGTETSVNQRNTSLNETILSGDIGTADDTSDNSYHVVVGAEGSVLNGFTITGGNANVTGYEYNSYAGALYIDGISMDITDCVFTNNHSYYAGAVFCKGFLAEPVFENCTFYKNVADSNGGAIACGDASSPDFNNCLFQENSAGTAWTGCGGAAMYIASSPTDVNGCVFYKNSAKYNGENNAYGGAIFTNSSEGCNVINSVFSENESDLGGAMLFMNSGKVKVVNCTFNKNTAKTGGAVVMHFNSNPDFINCIFWGDIASDASGIPEANVYTLQSDGILFKNCNISGGLPSGSWGLVVDGGGNINTDPSFVKATNPAGADGIFGTSDDGLILTDGSSCANAGTAENAPTVDILGVSRPTGAGYAMGAYENTIAADSMSPSIQITLPVDADTYTTTQNTIDISGTASDNNNVVSVSWSNSAGGSSTATGTTNWSINGIALKPGKNIITVTAHDKVDNTNTDVITVTYNAPPTVTIQLPSANDTYTVNTKTVNISGTSSVGTTKVSWLNTATGKKGTCKGITAWSASKILLKAGENIITVSAINKLKATGTDTIKITYVDNTAPVVKIKSPTSKPTHTLNKQLVSITGSAVDIEGAVSVKWSNAATGQSGTCTGTKSWKAAGVVLKLGQNVITITAEDAAGNKGTAQITITSVDKVKPKVSITTPTKNSTITVTTASITLGGIASDNVEIGSINWANSTGGSGVCTGLAAWTTQITLLPGKNKITITAKDTSNNIAVDTITVTYKAP